MGRPYAHRFRGCKVSTAPQAQRGAEHEEADDDRQALDAGERERLADAAVLDAVAKEGAGRGDGSGDHQQAAGVEGRDREADQATDVLERRADGERAGTVEPAGERSG